MFLLTLWVNPFPLFNDSFRLASFNLVGVIFLLQQTAGVGDLDSVP